jgi:ribose transport system substrate-binding protein
MATVMSEKTARRDYLKVVGGTVGGLVVGVVGGYFAGVASAPKAPAGAAGPPISIGVIGKSVHPYWSVVDAGRKAAGDELGIDTSFFVPAKEDVPKQISTVEDYITAKKSGIAFAPSDPAAAASVIAKALDAGIPLITIDTDAPDSRRLAYLGTNNLEAGRTAGRTFLEGLSKIGVSPSGAKVGIGVGSLTARNAIERIQGFKEVVEAAGVKPLETVNDKEDPVAALSLASSVLAANPDLVGAFGVYAYNGPAWARAVREAGKAGKILIVEFDATKENIDPIKEGTIYATVAQRQYFQGYLAVKLLYNTNVYGYYLADKAKGWETALKAFIPGYPTNKIYDTGTDVITKATLKQYYDEQVALGIPPDVIGWSP